MYIGHMLLTLSSFSVFVNRVSFLVCNLFVEFFFRFFFVCIRNKKNRKNVMNERQENEEKEERKKIIRTKQTNEIFWKKRKKTEEGISTKEKLTKRKRKRHRAKHGQMCCQLVSCFHRRRKGTISHTKEL